MSNGNYAMTPLPVVVFADFICPYSYIALDQMDDLLRDYNIELLWRPHWLHPEVPPAGAPLPAEAVPEERRARTLAWLREMAPERAAQMRFPGKISFCMLSRPSNSPRTEALRCPSKRQYSKRYGSKAAISGNFRRCKLRQIRSVSI